MKSNPHIFRNLTPHRIAILGSSIDPDPAGPARVAVTAEPSGYHAGIPIATPSYGEVTGLPEPATETLLIVSKMVADACPERQDLVWPGDPVLDDAGRVIGCLSLHRRPLEDEHCAQCCRFSLGAPDLLPSTAARGWANLSDSERRDAVAIIRARGLTRAADALESLPAIMAAERDLDRGMDRATASGACDMTCMRLRPEPTEQRTAIELPGLDRHLADRRHLERAVIRLACQMADLPDRRHITLPALVAAVEKLRES